MRNAQPTAINSIEGFILAGGASSRMGRDKSRLLFEGQTFVQRVAKELSSVTNLVTMIGTASEEAESKLPSAPDVHKNWGALGGLHAAISACRADWALVVACDLPFVTAALFARLVSLRGDSDAVAAIQSDDRPQPLCALYRTASCLTVAERLINSGERKPVALLQSIRTRWVPFSELEDLPGAQRFFDNINTPQDYARMCEKGDDTETLVMS